MENFCGSVFWDVNVSWNTQTPDFTLCFQNTVLTWIPCVFLWLFTPLECYVLFRKQRKPIPWTILTISKTILQVALLILTLAEIVINVKFLTEPIQVYPVHYCTPLIKLFSFILVLILTTSGRKNGRQSSEMLFIFWLLLTLSQIIIYRSVLLRIYNEKYSYEISEYSLTFAVIYLVLYIGELFLSCFADVKPEYYKVYDVSKNNCPEKYASFLSKVTFWWFNGMVYLGYKKPLELDDMWSLSSENRTRDVSMKFDEYWIPLLEENIRTKPKNYQNETAIKKISILYPLIKTFWIEFLLTAILKFIASVLTFVNPLILDMLIAFVGGNEPYWRGFVYAAIMFFSSMFESFFNSQYEFKVYTVAMRIRSCVISAIYKKSLILSSVAKRDFTVGEIVNLMAVDTQRMMDYIQLVNLLWSTPLQIGIAIYLLWQQLGISTLGGLAVMILFIPINGVITAKLKQLQLRLMKDKDKRINLMNEILTGIKILKLYAWEESFQKSVMDIRNREIKVLKTQSYLNSFIMFFFTSAPFLVGLASFTMFVFVNSENVLDANRAFVSLTLFNILRVPLAFLPMLITFTAMFIVSLRRVNRFLQCKELDRDAIGHDEHEDNPIVIEDAAFSWEDSKPMLKDISIQIKSGSLVAIVGQVGSGKSSFLSALLGEMEKLKGRVNIKGTLAYVPQQAWIQNTTLRNNILFTKHYKENKYNKILEACALKSDLEMLPAGDRTEIGEKGINLSGGQKQRVSLARAVYNDADIYLLDDPLSAVDSHVGKHIFQEVFGPNGVLKEKTRILVTHRISVLPEVDTIIVMNDGVISEYGTYKELLNRRGAFSQFLLQFLSESVEEVDSLPDDEIQLFEALAPTIGAPPELQRQLSRVSGAESELSESGDIRRRLSKQFSVSDIKHDFSKSEKDKINIRKEKKSKLTDAETIEVGSVKWSVYFQYFRTLGYCGIFITVISYAISSSFNIATNVWLSLWSNDASDPEKRYDTNLRDLRLGVYGGLGASETVFIFIGALSMNLACLRASKILHDEMLVRILHAPMSFFDTTPMGRVLNRFSKDVDTTDITIRFNIRMMLVQAFRSLVSFIIICMETALFLVVVIPIGIIYYLLQKFYIPTSRQMKRLESVTRSPIYAHFSETITGTSSIRAYRAAQKFIDESNNRVDTNHSCYYPSLAANRWLAIRLEFLGYSIVFFSALFAVLTKNDLNPGIVGLSVSYALTITANLNMLVRASADVETNIVSVERCLEYSGINTEAPRYNKSTKPDDSWPKNGNIKFENYSTRYREGLDLILNDITCDFSAGDKIGIVGRTGAGKSSLTLSLFRIIEAAAGKIYVDDVDISKIGLHDLRSKLTIIPQVK
ncbi:multidrug resistance-associated protein 1-like [Centruroides sculpturatus]|uniref:multidrug resistance-associated protein 1-like n=2 Tax=Centruroides sculpturatus TaxID=218467 RepID=UPI000C6D073F|nr:multidrug resistance-associated protein 1-like [Centruroides sculpturatus]